MELKWPYLDRLALFAAILLSFCLALLFSGKHYSPLKSGYLTAQSFNGKTDKPKTLLEENSHSSDRFVDLDVDLEFQSSGPTTNTQTLFQTNDLNKGIRVDLASSGKIYLIVETQDGTDHWTRELASTDLTKRIFHKLSIQFSRMKQVTVWLDNTLYYDFPVSNALPTISKVIVGEGFNSSQKYSGEIRNFSLKYQTYKKLNRFELLLVMASFFFFYLTSYLLFISTWQKFLNKSSQTASSSSLPRQLIVWIAFFVLMGYFVSQTVCYYWGNYWGLPKPWNAVFFDPRDAFHDFSNFFEMCKLPIPYESRFAIAYGPLLVFAFKLLTFLPSWLVFGCFIIASSISIVRFLNTSLERFFREALDKWLVMFILTAFSYPFLFCFDRGNVEFLMLVPLIWFCKNYLEGKDLKAVFWFSLAASFKISILPFALLFLGDRKFKQIALVGLAFIFWNGFGLFGLSLLGHAPMKELLLNYLKNISVYSDNLDVNIARFGHSLWALHVSIANAFDLSLRKAVTLSRWISKIVAVISIGIVLFKKNQFTDRLILTISTALLIAPISFDYRLIFLFLGLGYLLMSDLTSPLRASALFVLCCLISCTIPYPLYGDVNVSVPLRSLLILILWGISVVSILDANSQFRLRVRPRGYR